MRRVGTLLLLAAAALPLVAQDEVAEALQAVLDMEGMMLEDARQRYDALARRHGDLRSEIELLRSALDAAVHELEEPDPRRVTQLAEQLERSETERFGLLSSERLLLDRIAQHLQRLELLAQRIESLEDRGEAGEGLLSGTWDLTFMPAQQRGTVTLQQSGALVTGTYELEGGWTGSFQGTLVNRKVFLVRIDSKLGKSMELEGYLSSDGTRIRGSWLNYELAGGEGATGQWIAARREEPR
jgi:hypothetical protein